MREIDLVPADYVRARQTRRSLMRCVVAIALVLLAAAGARGWLALRLADERSAAVEARRQDGVASAQRAKLGRLKAAVAWGDAQVKALESLLDGTPADAWWHAVDAAYNGRIWLDAVAYARRLPEPARTTAAPAPAAAASATTSPAPEHLLELRGHALDHGAVTEFRRVLAEQPGVAAVRLTGTALQPFANREVVGFTLAATLASATPGPAPAPTPFPTPAPAPAPAPTTLEPAR